MTKRIIYYYQTFNGLDKMLYSGTPVTHIHLSSIHFGNNPDGSPYIHLNDNPPNDECFDDVWKQIKIASELGITIILMVGGAGGAFTNLFLDYDTYFPMLLMLLKQHPEILGIDLDVEEFVLLDNIKKLINDIISEMGEQFIIAFAPIPSSLETDNPGLGGFVYKDLYESNEGKYIQYFNCQFYGSYQPLDYESAVNNGYSPEKVVMGMISGQDFDTALQTLKNLATEYPNMGGAFIWEYFNAPDDWDIKVFNALNDKNDIINDKNDIINDKNDIINMGFYDKIKRLLSGLGKYWYN